MTDASPIRRFALVVGVGEESADAYIAIHAGPGIRDLLTAANTRNFSVFLHRLPDGKLHLHEFGYYE